MRICHALVNNIKKVVVFGFIIFLGACGNPSSNGPVETNTSGTIQVSADESFKPVIDSQVKVFEASWPNAKIITHYKPEADCIKDLNNDSIRMIFITRPLSRDEEALMKTRLGYVPVYGKLASDAISVIVNRESKDSLFDMSDIRSMVKGTSGYKYKVVLDGLSATSTVRYVTDSLAKGQPLGKNVMAATSSQGVIDYVGNNTDAIGLVGVSWIGNKEDTSQTSFLKKVKIAGIECSACQPVVYTQPYQYNIATRRYPMVRGLYYILKENYDGLGSGFSNFLIYERGQLIFKRAYLFPARMSFEVRSTQIN
ncbi:MAG TPA: substrate-binding domain-containing protein [Chitinophagaceae bacterium]|nr:substrate-binding domain-containing protein [Chitinophagaceae bacterium]